MTSFVPHLFRKKKIFGGNSILLNRKLWFQLKIFLHHLLLFIRQTSLILVQSSASLWSLSGKKIVPFYQKFKKIFNLRISIGRLNLITTGLSKLELLYTEDKILFLENELDAFTKKQPVSFSFLLSIIHLCRYNIYLKNLNKSDNWQNHVTLLKKKGKMSLLIQTFFNLWQNYFAHEKLGNKINSKPINLTVLKKIFYSRSFFSDIYFPFHQKIKKKTKKTITNPLQYTFIHTSENRLLYKHHSMRDCLEKENWLYTTYTLRNQSKKKHYRQFFLRKFDKLYTPLAVSCNFQKKRLLDATKQLSETKYEKYQLHWSVLVKLYNFTLSEIEICCQALIRNTEKNSYIDQFRLLIDFTHFLEKDDIFIQEKKNLKKTILLKKALVSFLGFPNTINK